MDVKLNAAKTRIREPLLLSAAVSLFAGLVAMLATRQLGLSLVVLGVAFILCVVLFVIFLLVIPNGDKQEKPNETFVPVLMRNSAPDTEVQASKGGSPAPESSEPHAGDSDRLSGN